MRETNRRIGSAGYSLIEVLVLLVLMTVVTSLATPSMNAYIGRTKTRRALDRIASDLAYARLAAVRSGQPSTVQFAAPSTYSVELGGAVPRQVRSVRLGLEYAGVVVTAPAASLRFNSRGLLASDPGSGRVVVTYGILRDSLFITPAGRVYRAF